MIRSLGCGLLVVEVGRSVGDSPRWFSGLGHHPRQFSSWFSEAWLSLLSSRKGTGTLSTRFDEEARWSLGDSYLILALSLVLLQQLKADS